MNDLDKHLTTQAVLTMAVVRCLIEKGLLTKKDLLNDVYLQTYDAPVPQEILADLQKLIESLHDR